MKFLYLFISILLIQVYSRTPEEDKVLFPMFEKLTQSTYSGYLASATGQQNYHYIFVESSAATPSDKPIILWVGGGPGGSAMQGLLQEIGPIMVESEENYDLNPFSWHSVANLLFIDSPAGVGFSTNEDTHLIYNDENTAKMNLEALQLWFDIFTKYRVNSLYIAGQSYAGMYIPYTASAILNYNKNAVNKINIKGVMIGNGRINFDAALSTNAQQQFLLNRNFIDLNTKHILNHQCAVYPDSFLCQQALMKFNTVMRDISGSNVYGYNYLVEVFKLPMIQIHKQPTPFFVTYLNTDLVQAALKVSKVFVDLNEDIQQIYIKNPAGSAKLLLDLKAAGLSILLYSGDLDASICVQETLDTLEALGLKQNSWVPIADEQKIIEGWMVSYDALDLAIVRGAGHSAAMDQQKAVTGIIQRFLSK